ncbi:MAG: hypothetical protein FWF97_00950 [Alphaproteobacteria bacterium]|nr:hypothetical protein [Alphaproteobacteria bacterium]
MMKKILPVIFATMFVLPTFANESALEEIKADLSEVKAPVVASNPKTEFPQGMQLGLGVSFTSGLNGFVGYANKNFDSFWWKRLGLRLDFATTSPIKSTINSAIDSAVGNDGFEIDDNISLKGNIDLKANHIGAIVDFYPFGDTWFLGGVRISGGYMTGKIGAGAGIKGTRTDDDMITFELNDTLYGYSGTELKVGADMTWKYSGPYLGTGFDLGLLWGVKIYMDAGAVFTSRTARLGLNIPLDNLWVSHDDGDNWDPVIKGTPVETELNTNKKAALRMADDELAKLKLFPMIKLGLMYRF